MIKKNIALLGLFILTSTHNLRAAHSPQSSSGNVFMTFGAGLGWRTCKYTYSPEEDEKVKINMKGPALLFKTDVNYMFSGSVYAKGLLIIGLSSTKKTKKESGATLKFKSPFSLFVGPGIGCAITPEFRADLNVGFHTTKVAATMTGAGLKQSNTLTFRGLGVVLNGAYAVTNELNVEGLMLFGNGKKKEKNSKDKYTTKSFALAVLASYHLPL